MAIFIKEIEGCGIGAFTAKDLDHAYTRAEKAHGENNVIDVHEAEPSELNYIRSMGGFVPSES